MASTLPCVRPDAPVAQWSDEPLQLDPGQKDLGQKDERPSMKRPPSGERRSHRVLSFLIMVFIGVAATLAWQSYGNVARELIANSSQVLGRLAPQPLTQVAPSQVTPTESAIPTSDLQQLRAALLDLAAMRQSVEQLAARNQELAGDIATMQAAQQNILRKVSTPAAPLPRQAPPARNAVQN